MVLRPPPPGPPPGFRALREGGKMGWVREDAVEWVRDSIRRHGSLYEAARVESGGHARYRGRAPVFLLRRGTVEYVVRRYTRGGAVATFLRDRYLRGRAPRPFEELRTSEALRGGGIATPRSLAAFVFPSGLFYRGELATERVTEASDLGELLFGERGPALSPEARVRLLSEAGSLLRRLAEAGVYHPDMNVKNLLAHHSTVESGLYLLDLDRCRIRGRPGPKDFDRMSRRLLRSIRKWEGRTGRPLGPGEVEALGHGAQEGAV